MKEITLRENGSKRVRTINEEPTLAQQQFKDQCDVNQIMKKYLKTGTITHINNTRQGVYADLSQVPLDYQEALNTVIRAKDAFQEVPSHIRLRFQNDPGQMLRFLADPANQEEAIKLGLMVRKPKTQETPIETPAPPQAPAT